jgi:class 3 adenylate cyclase
VLNIPEDENFTTLVNFNGILLAGSLNGIYEIQAGKATKIMATSVKILVPSVKYPGRLYIVYPSNSVGVLQNTPGGWSTLIFTNINAVINSAEEDTEGALVLGTTRGLIKLKPGADPTAQPENKLLVPDLKAGNNQRKTIVYKWNNYILASQGKEVYWLNGAAFRNLPLLSRLYKENRRFSFLKTGGKEWLLADKTLYELALPGTPDLARIVDSTRMLNLAKRLRFIFVDPQQNMWIADEDKLMQLASNRMQPAKESKKRFNTFFTGINIIENENGKEIRRPVENFNEPLELSYASHYNIEFEFSAPSFDNNEMLRYEYKIGEYDSWKLIDYNKLNLEFTHWGDYEFRVRAIDAYGNISNEAIYQFSIATPFWAQWWFYLLVLGIFALAGYYIYRYKQRQLIARKKELEEEVAKATITIREERDRSDKLLLNILPKEIAEELKANDKAIARRYGLVSVVFTDLKGFTVASEKLSPEDLVKELDTCFGKFDAIVQSHNLEKIKTMGDGYMCAGGIPAENFANPLQAVLAGLQMQNYMKRVADARKKRNEPFWELRLGIHTGELVAGVVGTTKFAYDIWGDTVNTASRLESSGEPGMVNVSETTYQLIQDYFDCTFRGKIAAKGKGEIAMYFVNRIKPEYSKDAEGVEPNDKLLAKVHELLLLSQDNGTDGKITPKALPPGTKALPA